MKPKQSPGGKSSAVSTTHKPVCETGANINKVPGGAHFWHLQATMHEMMTYKGEEKTDIPGK